MVKAIIRPGMPAFPARRTAKYYGPPPTVSRSKPAHYQAPDPYQHPRRNRVYYKLRGRGAKSHNSAPYLRDVPYLRDEPYLRDVPYLRDAPHLRDVPYLRDEPHLRDAPYLRDVPYLRDAHYLRDVPYLRDAPYVRDQPDGPTSSGHRETEHYPGALFCIKLHAAVVLFYQRGNKRGSKTLLF
jgi:hypothetical protein